DQLQRVGDGFDEVREVRGARKTVDLVDVGPGAERAARPVHDRCPDSGIRIDLVHGGGESAAGMAADRVEPGGADELHEGDRALAPDDDVGRLAHAIVRPPLTDSVCPVMYADV